MKVCFDVLQLYDCNNIDCAKSSKRWKSEMSEIVYTRIFIINEGRKITFIVGLNHRGEFEYGVKREGSNLLFIGQNQINPKLNGHFTKKEKESIDEIF